MTVKIKSIKIEIGKGKNVELSADKARELYNALRKMFEPEKEFVPITFPVIEKHVPYYPTYPIVTYLSTDSTTGKEYEVTCSNPLTAGVLEG